MKVIIAVFILAGYSMHIRAQVYSPESVSVSYVGEMITHPGIGLRLNYSLKNWTNERSSKQLLAGPSLGFFYHRRYQTSLYFIPEVHITRQNIKGNQIGAGMGVGYLRSFIPNTYQAGSDGQAVDAVAGHHYFATSIAVRFGRAIHLEKRDLGFYISPQFLYLLPNFPKGTGYFLLEIGVNHMMGKQ